MEATMAVSLTTPVTGGVVTGSTAPVYTIIADQAPDASTGKQWLVSALSSGTYTGLRFHSISDPWTITFTRPRLLKTLMGLVSGLTGLYGKVPDNVYGLKIRKGVNIAANNLPRVMEVDVVIRIPAGADAYDAANVRAPLSLLSGAVAQVVAGWSDTVVSGNL
jgi:hypothetical protein